MEYVKTATNCKTHNKVLIRKLKSSVCLMDDVHLLTARHFRYELRATAEKFSAVNLERARCASRLVRLRVPTSFAMRVAASSDNITPQATSGNESLYAIGVASDSLYPFLLI